MPQPTALQPSSDPPSFAGLLAALATPPTDTEERFWPPGEVAEDVATLSYDRALRASVRYRQGERGDAAIPMAATQMTSRALEETTARPDETEDALPALAGKAIDPAPDRELRPASVTIRLSKVECAQLRQRAAEAGMTVSAYLRSCTFEVDALRAQVKTVIAEMRKDRERVTPSLSEGARQRGNEGICLTRVLARVGRLCIGLSSRK